MGKKCHNGKSEQSKFWIPKLNLCTHESSLKDWNFVHISIFGQPKTMPQKEYNSHI